MMMTIEKIKFDYLRTVSVKSWEETWWWWRQWWWWWQWPERGSVESGEREVLGERTERRLRDVSRFLPPARESLNCALATLSWRLCSSICILLPMDHLCLSLWGLLGRSSSYKSYNHLLIIHLFPSSRDSWADHHKNLNQYLYLRFAHLCLLLWGNLSKTSS